MHREWELSLGQRTAVARAAHLLCELHLRLDVVGLARPQGFDLAINQTELAECMGITAVHMNRVLKELRELGLATVRNKEVVIHDLDGLKRLAEFDPTYLYLRQQPL
jgi:CRP-like cAMP-binding protein